MKKISLLLFLLPVTVVSLSAQKPTTGCAKLFYQSSQLTDTTCDEDIKNIQIASSGNVVVENSKKEKRYVPEDSLWGIRRKNENPLRFFNGNQYSLIDISPVYRYSRQVGRYSESYFSTGLDSPVYAYTPGMLKKHTDSATYAALVAASRTNRHERSFDVFASKTTILNNSLFGGGFSMKSYPQKKWGTGFLISGASKRTPDTFGFSIARPLLCYYEVGWVNSFDIVQKNWWRTGVSLLNGLAIVDLRDKAQTEKRHTRSGDVDVPKRIATNYYYLLEPGIDFSVKVVSNNHNPDFYLTGSAKYRMLFGNSGFGTQKMNSGALFSLGISVIGFGKEELH